MLTLFQTEIERLEEPISSEEVTTVIKELKSAKSPDPDRLTSQYYKMFELLLSKPLTFALNYINRAPNPSNDLILACITVTVAIKKETTTQLHKIWRP